jgi:uncharacterized membrane protein (DUF2068 family)
LRRPRRIHLNYELISCGLSGHELVGTDAAELRDEDALVARLDAATGLRWHRCLRCDSWLPLAAPSEPARRHPPSRHEITLPLRGRPLRDKYALRLIALDRAFHFVILGVIAIAIFAYLNNRIQLRHEFFRVISDIQGGVGGVQTTQHGGLLGDLQHILSLKQSTLYLLGFVFAGYALLEGIEAVGLWMRKRWAEYLTFIATTILLVPEVYELTKSASALKLLTLLINVAIVAYLLYAKRLFGINGGGAVERAELERDSGWEALERSTPAAANGPPHPV